MWWPCGAARFSPVRQHTLKRKAMRAGCLRPPPRERGRGHASLSVVGWLLSQVIDVFSYRWGWGGAVFCASKRAREASC